MEATRPVTTIDQVEAARVLLAPPRLAILEQASQPQSATQIGASLGLTRQRVNYHVQALAKVGLLVNAGQRKRGNFLEQQWQRSAGSYVLAPDLLGPLALDWRSVADRDSAGFLVALAARTLSEVGRAATRASEGGGRLATLSLDVDVGFSSPEQRKAFSEALVEAVSRVVEDHTTAPSDEGARPYRLVLGCHPVPPTGESS